MIIELASFLFIVGVAIWLYGESHEQREKITQGARLIKIVTHGWIPIE